MNEQKHIINRQVLELTIPERDRVQFIQNKTSEIVRQKLHPALDSVFSNLVDEDEIIRIDKLVIDIGTISENDLETVLVERTVKEIEGKINSLLKLETKTSKQIPINGYKADTRYNFITTSKSEDFLDRFVFFLQSGHFPWWHIPSDSNDLEKIYAAVLKYDVVLLKKALIPLLGIPSVRQRLVFQFNQSQLDSLLERMNDKLFKSYYSLFQVLLSCTGSTVFKTNITDQFYKIVLQNFNTELELNSENQKIGFVKDLLDLVLSKQSDSRKEPVLTEILAFAQLKQQESVSKDELLIMAAVIQVAAELGSIGQPLNELIQNIPEKNKPVVNKLVERFMKKTKSDKIRKIEEKTEEFKEDRQNLSPEIEIVISNAGLVIIHPFLRYFFEGLNLLNKELQFKSKPDAFKAVHLLQFIATGQENTLENDLPLNKILCGLDETEPVPVSVSLSEVEKEECFYLIKTVLERWEALKTTNPVALRETFLQREGILKQAGQSWNLTIERNTFDVMLERLPWSISLIKLPWLEQILYVEW